MRVSDVAYEKIKMMIITARLRPGQTLVEAELMEELGMGRLCENCPETMYYGK